MSIDKLTRFQMWNILRNAPVMAERLINFDYRAIGFHRIQCARTGNFLKLNSVYVKDRTASGNTFYCDYWGGTCWLPISVERPSDKDQPRDMGEQLMEAGYILEDIFNTVNPVYTIGNLAAAALKE